MWILQRLCFMTFELQGQLDLYGIGKNLVYHLNWKQFRYINTPLFKVNFVSQIPNFCTKWPLNFKHNSTSEVKINYLYFPGIENPFWYSILVAIFLENDLWSSNVIWPLKPKWKVLISKKNSKHLIEIVKFSAPL